ncbi:HAMP domain-containing histidine kinase [bacterium]|nr:MAG: HAMP domain-containing histidine kinase [bacterium]
MRGMTNDAGFERLGVPVWRGGDEDLAPMNAPARQWHHDATWPRLSRLMRALLRVPGYATGSYESEGKVYQLLTIDGEDGPMVMMRPVRPGEDDGEVERRLAEIVHDLSAPVTSLRLRLGNIRQDRTDDETLIAELLVADREIARLQAIIRDAAALGRLSAHLLKLTPVDTSALLQAVSATLAPLAQANGVRLVVHSAPGTMTVDRLWIERAITNLGDNAIRHSPRGEPVTIEAETTESGWRVRVRDHGRGISPEALSGHLDVPGEFGPNGLAGLGLTLVRRIVAAHNGGLEVLSEQGLGSVFTIDLPQSRREERVDESSSETLSSGIAQPK